MDGPSVAGLTAGAVAGVGALLALYGYWSGAAMAIAAPTLLLLVAQYRGW